MKMFPFDDVIMKGIMHETSIKYSAEIWNILIDNVLIWLAK